MEKLTNDGFYLVTQFLNWQDCVHIEQINREWMKKMNHVRFWPRILMSSRLPVWNTSRVEEIPVLQEYLGISPCERSIPKRDVHETNWTQFLVRLFRLGVSLHTLVVDDIKLDDLHFIQHMPLRVFHCHDQDFLSQELNLLKKDSLVSLNLQGMKNLRDSDLQMFKTCAHLQELVLDSTLISGYGFLFLIDKCKQLSRVSLNKTCLQDKYVSTVCQFPLISLSIDQTTLVTDASLPRLKDIPDLSFQGVPFSWLALRKTWPHWEEALLLKKWAPHLKPKIPNEIMSELWDTWQGTNHRAAMVIHRDLISDADL